MNAKTRSRYISYRSNGAIPWESIYRWQPGIGIEGWVSVGDVDPGWDKAIRSGVITTEGDINGCYFHGCSHGEYTMGTPQGSITIEDYPPIIGHYKYYTNMHNVCAYLTDDATGTLQDCLEALYPELQARADTWCKDHGARLADSHLREMKDPLDSGFSLPTFVRESRELVQSLRRVLSIGKTLKQLAKHFGDRNLREILRIIGEEHLTWAFGILPALNDINSIVRILKNHREVILSLYVGHQRTFIYHKMDVLPWFSFLDRGTVSVGRYRGTGGTWYVRHRPQAELKCYLRYYLRAGDIIRSPNGSFLALLDLLGLHADPEIIWDAVPFSFLVDWFLDIGDNLHAMRKNWVDVDMTVVDSAYHLSVGLAREWFYETTDYSPLFIEGLSYFKRIRYVPKPLDSADLPKRLSLHKILISASLLATRGRATR